MVEKSANTAKPNVSLVLRGARGHYTPAHTFHSAFFCVNLRLRMKRSLFFAALISSAFAQQPIGTMQSQDATIRGAVTIRGAATELRSGSEIQTGASAANVELARGGKLRICPRSSVQITSSPDGRALLVALNSGSLETDYLLSESADAIMTAEFQLQLAGPGTFHYAFGSNGNELCARGLAGSNASVIASETLGAGTYQLRPADNIVFRGSLSNPDAQPQNLCGCPEEMVIKDQPTELGFPEQQSRTAAKAMAEGSEPPSAPPLPQIPQVVAQSQPITQISVPLMFRSSEVALPPLPEPYVVAELRVLPAIALPKIAPPPKPKKNWLQRFFGKLFR
jgi:hypothetical protein